MSDRERSSPTLIESGLKNLIGGRDSNYPLISGINDSGSGNRWSNVLVPRDIGEQQHQQVHNTSSNISNSFASHQRNFLNYGNMACYQRIYNENGFNLTTNAQNYHQYHNSTHPHQHQQQKQYYDSGKSGNSKDICGDDKFKEDGDPWNVEAQVALLGPNLWDKTLPYDTDLKVTHVSQNNYQGLILRSEVLYRLSHFKSSLADADNAVKSRPTSYKAHLRRAYALSSLGQREEALSAFCLSKWPNKISSNSQTILPDVAKLLHQLLSSTRKAPLASPYTMRRRRKRRHYNRKLVAESSDCDEENSSCSEETNFTKIRQRRVIERRLKSANTYNVIDSVIFPRPNTRIREIIDSIHQEIYIIQKTDSTNVFKVNPSLVEVTDFDCVLCYRTLWKPVVTPCGHTFCMVCLDRCLDRCLYYSSHCPLCKSSFEDDYSMNIVRNALSRKYVTKFIEIAMQRFIPVAYEKRKLQEIEKEEFVPVFICTVSFPYVPCPLFGRFF